MSTLSTYTTVHPAATLSCRGSCSTEIHLVLSDIFGTIVLHWFKQGFRSTIPTFCVSYEWTALVKSWANVGQFFSIVFSKTYKNLKFGVEQTRRDGDTTGHHIAINSRQKKDTLAAKVATTFPWEIQAGRWQGLQQYTTDRRHKTSFTRLGCLDFRVCAHMLFIALGLDRACSGRWFDAGYRSLVRVQQKNAWDAKNRKKLLVRTWNKGRFKRTWNVQYSWI